ncbi:hypothetical protein ACIPW5_23645 [Streptomyces sp. NPDC090077]|uniref:hypothetical protein n=1 Tax=Streptomyces sp. NPDC090077 TaxID=3365938 RepID=UPI0038111907
MVTDALPPAPGLDGLRAAARVYARYRADLSWGALLAATAPGIDLSEAAHRTALHRWLNAWGCRLRYPRRGEPDPLDAGLAAWWARHTLPRTPIAALTDAEVGALAAAYGELAALPAGRRTLGPTAAAKALFAVRPHTVMPWDAAIAVTLHGARDERAFARHLHTGRAWARAALAESGLEEHALTAYLGREDVSLAKLLDEYLYVTLTRGREGMTP